MSNEENPPSEEIANRVEGGVRKLFERIGGALDFALRRPMNPQARTDLTALIPQIERLLDDKLRTEGGKIFAPNLIELRYDYETYSQMPAKRREYLERELRLSTYEYIHNRRYTTKADVKVNVAYDMFTRKLTLKASFPDEVSMPAAAPAQNSEQAATAPTITPTFEVNLQNPKFTLRAKNSARINVGRGHDNGLIIEDGTVSSVHAAFTINANGAIFLADLGSRNGTFVNGVQIPMGDKAIVKSGDKVRFGDIELQLTLN